MSFVQGQLRLLKYLLKGRYGSAGSHLPTVNSSGCARPLQSGSVGTDGADGADGADGVMAKLPGHERSAGRGARLGLGPILPGPNAPHHGPRPQSEVAKYAEAAKYG